MKWQRFIGTVAMFAAMTMPARGNEEIVFATTGTFEFYSRPQEAPEDGLVATVVGVRTLYPRFQVGRIDGLHVTGDVHQTWWRNPRLPTFVIATPLREDTLEYDSSPVPPNRPFPLPLAGHAVADSHLIPLCDVEIICDRRFIREENDASNPLQFEHDWFNTLDGSIDNYEQIYGEGALEVTGAAGLQFIEPHLAGEKDLLYLVTRADPTTGEPIGVVHLSMGIVGVDAEGVLSDRYSRIEAPGVQVPFAVPEPALPLGMIASCALIAFRRATNR